MGHHDKQHEDSVLNSKITVSDALQKRYKNAIKWLDRTGGRGGG
jgi:hypothetical protein